LFIIIDDLLNNNFSFLGNMKKYMYDDLEVTGEI